MIALRFIINRDEKNIKSEYQVNKALHIDNVMRFYFKVNNSKLQDKSRLANQIKKVIKRLIEINNINAKYVELLFGTVGDDFISDRCRLRISFNCH